MEKPFKEQVEDLIKDLQSNNYDPERAHIQYDALLEEFILNYNEALLPLMRKLIDSARKVSFWYA